MVFFEVVDRPKGEECTVTVHDAGLTGSGVAFFTGVDRPAGEVCNSGRDGCGVFFVAVFTGAGAFVVAFPGAGLPEVCLAG